jgi:hypothetical protein
VTAALVLGQQVTIGHVGDSRIYSVHPSGRVEQLTQDHSLVRRLNSAPEQNRPQPISPQCAISVDRVKIEATSSPYLFLTDVHLQDVAGGVVSEISSSALVDPPRQRPAELAAAANAAAVQTTSA